MWWWRKLNTPWCWTQALLKLSLPLSHRELVGERGISARLVSRQDSVLLKGKWEIFKGEKKTIRSTLFKAPTQGPTTIVGTPYGVACLCVICFPILPLVQLGRRRSCQTKASAWEGLCRGQIEEAGGGPDFNGRLQFESMFLTTLLRVIRQ